MRRDDGLLLFGGEAPALVECKRAFHKSERVKDKERSNRYSTYYIEISLTGECVLCGHWREDHSEILPGDPCLDCACGGFHGKQRPCLFMTVRM